MQVFDAECPSILPSHKTHTYHSSIDLKFIHAYLLWPKYRWGHAIPQTHDESSVLSISSATPVGFVPLLGTHDRRSSAQSYLSEIETT